MNVKNICIDADLESRASSVLSYYGLNLNDAIVDYLNKIVQHNNSQVVIELNKVKKMTIEANQDPRKILTLEDLPENERERRLNIIHTKGPTSEAIGVLKGMVWMSEDFDEPLDCMQDYME